MPCLNPKLSALALVAPLIGCVSKPEPGRYIVLNPPAAAAKMAAHRPAPRGVRNTAVATSSKTADTPNAAAQDAEPASDPQGLTPAEREDLFRRFEAYLNQPGHQ